MTLSIPEVPWTKRKISGRSLKEGVVWENKDGKVRMVGVCFKILRTGER